MIEGEVILERYNERPVMDYADMWEHKISDYVSSFKTAMRQLEVRVLLAEKKARESERLLRRTWAAIPEKSNWFPESLMRSLRSMLGRE